MSDLPPGWMRTSVGDIAEVRGGIQKQAKRRPVANKYPFLRVANVGRGILNLEEVHEIELFHGELERFALQAGDLLVVEGNGSPGEIGRAAMWRGEIPNCVHQNHLICVRPTSAVHPKFLELLWGSPEIAQQIREVASSTSGLYTLSTAKIRAIRICLPPYEEQCRIVAALEDHLSRLEHAESILSGIAIRLSSLYRAILKEKFRNVSLGTTSRNRKLGDVAIIASGQTPGGISEYLSAESGVDCVPFYKVGDMNHSDGRFMSSSRTYIHRDDAANIGLKIRPAGTILIPKRGGAIATNKKRILRIPSTYDLNTMGIIPSQEVDSIYLWRWFEQINLAELSDGSNVPQLNNPDLINLEISVPDLPVQQTLAEELEILTTGVTRLLRTVNELRKSPLRSMLLKEAFSGQLVVQDPADEPIAVLLERIHAERVTQSRPRRRRREANLTLQKETQL